jgi:hypothetical protein
MGETGNKRAAAEAAGVDPSTIDAWLRKDPGFAAEWAAAAEAVDRRLAAARSPSEGVADGTFETIQRSRTGRLQIQSVREGRWTKAIEDRFIAALRNCGNLAACARLVGFSEAAIWQRRDKWPAFAERMDKALDEAEVVLEFRLATLGNNVGAGMDEDGDEEEGKRDSIEEVRTSPGRPQPCPGDRAASQFRGNDEVGEVDPIPFDPEFALKFLKWREEKRRGRRQNRGAAVQRRVTEAELTASLEAKLSVLRKRHLAQGWIEDEETGCLIPPGWVRKADEGGPPGRAAGGLSAPAGSCG